MKPYEAIDNTMAGHKAALRIRNLPPDARVLDLFCGAGEMFRRAYAGRVEKYFGVDKEKIHDPDLCVLEDNVLFVMSHDISGFNVFDLDDYGCPWPLLYLIMGRGKWERMTLFITDGISTRMNVDGRVTKWISATEGMPFKMVIPGLKRFYVDIFGTMLRGLEDRFDVEVVKALYFRNKKNTAYYWVIEIEG